MIFNIVIDPPALKELKKIKKGVPQVFIRLVKSIDALANDPRIGKPLQGNKKGCYSLRDGDYRVVYEIHLDDRVIHVITAGHRKDIYR